MKLHAHRYLELQCCGTETIYSQYGLNFDKVLVPNPDPSGSRPNLAQFFQCKMFTKSFLFNARNRIVALKLSSNFWIV
jgi:hypothetical protein